VGLRHGKTGNVRTTVVAVFIMFAFPNHFRAQLRTCIRTREIIGFAICIHALNSLNLQRYWRNVYQMERHLSVQISCDLSDKRPASYFLAALAQVRLNCRSRGQLPQPDEPTSPEPPKRAFARRPKPIVTCNSAGSVKVITQFPSKAERDAA
jgi:hypothetical protein